MKQGGVIVNILYLCTNYGVLCGIANGLCAFALSECNTADNTNNN